MITRTGPGGCAGRDGGQISDSAPAGATTAPATNASATARSHSAHSLFRPGNAGGLRGCADNRNK